MQFPCTFQINAANKPEGSAVTANFFRNAAINIPFLYTLTRFYLNIKTQRRRWKASLFILTTLLGKKNLHILLGDDDEEDQEIFTAAMREVAPEVKISLARDGRQVMKVLQSGVLPDVIFLDLNMPLKDGKECLEEIRAHKEFNKIPVVIYSTSAAHEHIDETYNKGADYYVCKPDSFIELKNIAKKVAALQWGVHTRPTRDRFVLSAGKIK